MNLFKKYLSNTYVGSCSNYMLFSETPDQEITSRMFFRVIDCGNFPYRFYFRNIVDSTYSNGAKSQANLMGDPLIVKSAYVGSCDGSGNSIEMVSDIPLTQLTFDGESSVKIEPGCDIWCDEVTVDVKADKYLVF